ncbi:MAG: hypothetical protein PHV82_04510 [Victivallaceae bacterium]|nr:hypothetical protein [Victivallaceae bacterium]
MEKINNHLILRPYQVLCIICSLGKNQAGSNRKILETLRRDPEMPVALCCNCDDQFKFQNPGTNDDTPEGADYNQKRDFDILLRMDLVPGTILPARIIFKRALKMIKTTSGICGYNTVTADKWRGCPRADSGCYEKIEQIGIDAIFPPLNQQQMCSNKEKSLCQMLKTEPINVRPHILICMIAQYGQGITSGFEKDNLPELLQIMLKSPQKMISLVPGADPMICAPCPSKSSQHDFCTTGIFASGGLYNELKDLNVLQALGLTYHTSIQAGKLLALILQKIPETKGVCAFSGSIPETSLWRERCGLLDGNCAGFDEGRERLMAQLFPSNGRDKENERV